MGVYIKGMKMPTICADCGFCANGGEHETDFCKVQLEPCEYVIGGMMWKEVKSNEIDKGCPLVEVATPHGRLVDADDINNHIARYVCLDGAPTVIESEE